MGWLLGILGFGGVVGIALRFLAPGLFETIAAALTGIARSVPPKVWIAIAVVALLVTGYFVHRHYAHKALAAEYARGSSDEDRKWQKRLDDERAAAEKWRLKAEANAAKITQEIGARHDQEVHAIDARADAQRLHGPGAAAAPACVGPVSHPSVSPGASGHVATSGDTASGLAGLPPEGGLAIVPWNDLVTAGRIADDSRAEVKAWREWYARQVALNKAMREAKPN